MHCRDPPHTRTQGTAIRYGERTFQFRPDPVVPSKGKHPVRAAHRVLCGVSAALLLAAATSAQEGAKAQLVVSAETFKTSIPGLEGVKLPPEAQAALGASLAGQRMLNVRLQKPGAPPAAPTAMLDIPVGLKLGPTLELEVDRPGKPGANAVDPEVLKQRFQGFEMLRYWGCSATVRAGQPKTVKAGEFSAEALSRLPGAAGVGGRGADSTLAVWPNAKAKDPQVQAAAALPGKYALKSNFVPGIGFEVPAGVTFLDAVSLTVPQGPDALDKAVPVSWKAVPGALAYFGFASGLRGKTMIMWNTAEQDDALGAAFDDSADAKALIAKGVYLSPERTSCTIPAGIFKGCQGVSVQLIAVGPSFVQGGSNPSVKVTTRSTGTTILGANFGAPGND